MKYIGFKTFLVSSTLLLIGCGGGSSSDFGTVVDNPIPLEPPSTGTLPFIPAPANTAPVADEKSITVNSGSSVSIVLSGSDAEGDALSYRIVSDPLFGILNGTAPNLIYTPSTGYSGLDSFTYTVNDGTVDAVTVKVSIEVLSNSSVTNVSLSGTVKYDLVPAKSTYDGLDYVATRQVSAKYLVIEAVDTNGNTLTSSNTDENGSYTLLVPENTDIKIRVSAQMRRADTITWDVKVVDNTNSDALYVMEGSLLTSGTNDSTRNLEAPSGWGGTSYTSTRVAAPFAMLDSVYHSMQKVLSADAQAVFSPLLVNWSIDNKAAIGDPANGDIGTSYYYDSNLFILGDENFDTDEYDDHVIAHEWAHYYEDTFSRSDSIGGPHSDGEILDIRVAFGEGWGNAFSAIALDHPVYFDTYGSEQANGFNFNMESETKDNAGWYSEGSIQRILYDIYDDDNEGSDILSLGFAPIHKVFTGQEKTTPLFTSLFSFITYLKDENPADETKIDSIVSSEDIASITDILGSGRTNRADELPKYFDLNVGSTVNICPSYDHGVYNALGNRKYIRFNINSSGNYTISVEKSSLSGTTDPDFYLHNMSTHTIIAVGEDANADIETQSVDLPVGSYLLDVYDYESISATCFDVTVN